MLRLKTLWFILEERLLGNNFQICPDIYELWVLDFVVTIEAEPTVFQRAYSAKWSLGLVSIFQQGVSTSNGVSTSAHSCHKHYEQFHWRLDSEQADLVLLFIKCVCVCVCPLSIPSRISLSQYVKCFFPAHITNNAVPEADCTSLVCLSDTTGNLWSMSFLWDRSSGWAC